MRPMTHAIRKQIALCRKNHQDIADIIQDVEIKGEDLSSCVITKLNRSFDDISHCNFGSCVIGKEKEEIVLVGTNMQHCNFKQARILGKFNIKKADARWASFYDTYMPYTEYQHTDLRGCNFCDAIFRYGSRAGHGAKMDKHLIEFWAIEWNDKETKN